MDAFGVGVRESKTTFFFRGGLFFLLLTWLFLAFSLTCGSGIYYYIYIYVLCAICYVLRFVIDRPIALVFLWQHTKRKHNKPTTNTPTKPIVQTYVYSSILCCVFYVYY